MPDDANLPDPLTELILDQSMAGVAVPVLLSGPDDDLFGLGDHPSGETIAPFTAQAYAEQCRLGLAVIEGRHRAPSGILALNFHELRPENRAVAEHRLVSLARVGPSWTPDGPGAPGELSVFVGFYDGYRDTAMWGAELCDRLGLRAHFFPIFTGTEPGEAGLSDVDLAELACRHTIGFHTDSHLFITEVNADNVAAEVSGPVERIRAAVGEPPLLGAWCGGTRFDPAEVGNQVLATAGVRYLISNWSIEPVPVTEPGR